MEMANGNGGVGFTDAGVLALLADTNRAGRGGFWGGGEGGYFGGPYANLSSIQHGIANTSQKVEDAADCNRDVFAANLVGVTGTLENLQRDNQFTSTNTNIRDGFNRICDRLNFDAVRMTDMIFQQELRNGDRLRDLQAEMNANARAAADCCCDIKVQAANDKAEILAQMQALSKEGIARDLDRAERELVALRTQVACGCTTGCSRRCHD